MPGPPSPSRSATPVARSARSSAPNAAAMPAWIARPAPGSGACGSAPRASHELARRVGALVREADVDRRYQGQLAVNELDKLALLHSTAARRPSRTSGPRSRGRAELDLGDARRHRRAPDAAGDRAPRTPRRHDARAAPRRPSSTRPGPPAPRGHRSDRGRRETRARSSRTTGIKPYAGREARRDEHALDGGGARGARSTACTSSTSS